MGDLVRFVSRSERERARLIEEARAIYDSIFPCADYVRETRSRAPASPPVGRGIAARGHAVLLSLPQPTISPLRRIAKPSARTSPTSPHDPV